LQSADWRREVERLARLDWDELIGEVTEKMSAVAGVQPPHVLRIVSTSYAEKCPSWTT
jgi:hypothetical protein